MDNFQSEWEQTDVILFWINCSSQAYDICKILLKKNKEILNKKWRNIFQAQNFDSK